MNDQNINALILAAAKRQLAVAALQNKYQTSASVPTEQLVLDMRELLSTERVALDAIITLFVKLGHGTVHAKNPSPSHLLPVSGRRVNTDKSNEWRFCALHYSPAVDNLWTWVRVAATKPIQRF